MPDIDNSSTGFTLPRADGGKDAWLVLFSCFILEALVWGEFTFSRFFSLSVVPSH